MLDITSILSSKARIKILRTLFYQSQPLPLRHVVYLSNSPLFSVQRALIQLAKEKIVKKKKQKQYVLFSLNRNHPSYSFLAGLFDLEMKSQKVFLANHYSKKAKGILDFSCSAQSLLKGMR